MRLVLALPLLLCACNSSSSTDDSGKTDDSEKVTTTASAYPEFATCAGDLSDAEVETQLVILDEMAESLHEMVACGGLYFALLDALVNVLVDFVAQGADGVQTPDGFSYLGDGVYQTVGTGVQMDVTFYFGDDYEAGARGSPVTANLFDAASYLVNATTSIDSDSFELLLYHDGPGPLVELLGEGTNPSSPIRVGTDDVTGLSAEILKLLVDMEILVDLEEPLPSTYGLYNSQTLVSNTMSTGLVELLPAGSATAERSETEQSLVTTDWSAEYERQGTLVGTIGFTVTGGLFDFTGIWTYDYAGYPTYTLSCAG